MQPLRIVHVLRTPVGGLFRHVLDLTEGQAQAGHHVSIIADSSTGGPQADEKLQRLRPLLKGGVHRLPMRRDPHPADFAAQIAVSRLLSVMEADIVHGHGSKGGLYARLPALNPLGRKRLRVYTPHGGSLHFPRRSLPGRVFTLVERALERGTDLLLFESRFAAERFSTQITASKHLVRVVHNGLSPAEFAPVAPAADATDILFVGEMRILKGVDTLIEAAALMARETGRAPTLTLVGAGPDEAAFRALTDARGLAGSTRFAGAMPARDAFRLGRVMVTPSRAESLPYIVLETIAASIPIVATEVGGVPEIFGPDSGSLVAPDAPALLAEAIFAAHAREAAGDRALVERLQARARSHFSVETMVRSVLGAYAEAQDGAPNRASP